MKTNKYFLIFILLFLTQYALAEKPIDSEYIDGGKGKIGVILAHGKGKHPTWLVVDPLRKEINNKLGYHTLSLQMPIGYGNWKDYADGFSSAYNIIKNGINYLKKEKKVTKIYLIGHSMGSRMSSAFVSANPEHSISGLVVAGCRNNGGYPLSCKKNLQNINIPVLDIWGGNNSKDSDSALERESMISNRYTQVKISGANHKFEGYEAELVDAVVKWIEAQK